MNRKSRYSLTKDRYIRRSAVPIYLILALLLFLNACTRYLTKELISTITSIQTETLSLTPKPTQTLTTTSTKRLTVTPKSTSTSTIIPTKAPTATLKPFLISYTFYPDGGDDLWICLGGHFRPTFILYSDGLLVFLRDGQ